MGAVAPNIKKDIYDNNDCGNYYHHYHQAVKQSRHLFARFSLLSFNIPFICYLRL